MVKKYDRSSRRSEDSGDSGPAIRTPELGDPIPKALLIIPAGSGRDTVASALRDEGLSIVLAEDLYAGLTEFVRYSPLEQPQMVVLSLEGLTPTDRAFLRELRFMSPDVRILVLVPEGRRESAAHFLDEYGDAQMNVPCYTSEVRVMARSLLRAEASDPLTHLPSRAATMRAFAQAKERAARDHDKSTLCFCVLELDEFAGITAQYGHELGDMFLRETASRMRDSFRMTDIVGRWNGEEFIVVLAGLPTDEGEARALAGEALSRAVDQIREDLMPATPGKDPLKASISGGLVLFPQEGITWEELLLRAQGRLRDWKTPGHRLGWEETEPPAEDPEGPEPEEPEPKKKKK